MTDRITSDHDGPTAGSPTAGDSSAGSPTVADPSVASSAASVRAPFEVAGRPTLPLVATAIHAGHDVRPGVAGRLVLDDATRFREEDPFTDRIAASSDAHLVVHRSRFEVDLNRARESAVYRTPDDAWGLELWEEPLPDAVVQGSLAVYDAFYDTLAQQLDALAAKGPFVVFDVHSYNHRRDGRHAPAAPAVENPDVNVGTGSLDRTRWAPVVDALLDSLHGVDVGGGAPLDARENVRFRGANLAKWVHTRYPDTGCALALEFKKTFMDEWTGELDHHRLDALTEALGASIPRVVDALDRVRR